jgi:hypothetical protein
MGKRSKKTINGSGGAPRLPISPAVVVHIDAPLVESGMRRRRGSFYDPTHNMMPLMML